MKPIVLLLSLLGTSVGFAEDVFLIHGRVLREDLTEFSRPVDLTVIARRPGDPAPVRAEIQGSSYQIRIPANRAVDGSIWTIEFEEATRHPGSVSDISGPATSDAPQSAWVHHLDKVLLPEDGPRNFDRNIEQLLEYERIWFDRIARGMTVDQLIES